MTTALRRAFDRNNPPIGAGRKGLTCWLACRADIARASYEALKVEWEPALPSGRNASRVRYPGFTVACAAGGRRRNLGKTSGTRAASLTKAVVADRAETHDKLRLGLLSDSGSAKANLREGRATSIL